MEFNIENFWAKVNKTETCWLWTAALNPGGYGRLRGRSNGKRVMRLAHRLSFEIHNGEIPEGMQVDHACHRKACVNPDHLRAATNKENGENLAGPHADSSSGIRGVSWHKRAGKWAAYVRHQNATQYLGLFDTAEEAGEVARLKRLELFTHNNADRVAA